MEAALARAPRRHARLLEEVPLDVGARNRADRVEVDPHELAEPGRVVVLDSLRVPERLEDRVRVEDLSLEVAELLARGPRERAGVRRERVDGRRGREGVRGDGGEELNNLFGVLSLAGAGLATASAWGRSAVETVVGRGGETTRVTRMDWDCSGFSSIDCHACSATA